MTDQVLVSYREIVLVFVSITGLLLFIRNGLNWRVWKTYLTRPYWPRTVNAFRWGLVIALAFALLRFFIKEWVGMQTEELSVVMSVFSVFVLATNPLHLIVVVGVIVLTARGVVALVLFGLKKSRFSPGCEELLFLDVELVSVLLAAWYQVSVPPLFFPSFPV